MWPTFSPFLSICQHTNSIIQSVISKLPQCPVFKTPVHPHIKEPGSITSSPPSVYDPAPPYVIFFRGEQSHGGCFLLQCSLLFIYSSSAFIITSHIMGLLTDQALKWAKSYLITHSLQLSHPHMISEEARWRFNLRQRNKSVVEFPNELCVLMAEQVGDIHLHYSLNDKLKVELTM